MKSSEAIINFINERIQLLIVDPQSHSPCAESLEEVLIALDFVRQFACSSEKTLIEPNNRRYFDFLRKRGFGVCTVSGRSPIDNTMSDAFENVTVVWKEYIEEFSS